MGRQSKSFERVNQKQRTRRELLLSADALVRQGGLPTVAEVADNAGISRATAYRYFSTVEALLQALADERVRAEIVVAPAGPHDDLCEHVADLVSMSIAMLEKDEALFRALLASRVAAPDAPSRTDRRVEWLTQVLAPLEARIGKRDLRRLAMALSLTCGIETLVALKDGCGLKAKDVREVALFTVRALMTSVLNTGKAEADPGKVGSPQLHLDLG